MFDAGTHYMVSGYSEASVREAVQKLAAQGGKLISEVSKVGAQVAGERRQSARRRARAWRSSASSASSRRRRARRWSVKVRELLEMGATLVQEAELADGVWTAVCEKT